MKRRHEVHEFDYAVVALVLGLNSLMPCLRVAGGINFTVEEDSFAVKRVDIRPRSWPKDSFITARFTRRGDDWEAFEGAIIASHIASYAGRLNFSSKKSLNGLYSFNGRGTHDIAFLESLK